VQANTQHRLAKAAACVLILAALAGCSQPPSSPPAPILLRLSGSTSMQPLMRELAEAYSARRTHVSFGFSAVGSGAGLQALRRGSADVALVSRSLQPEEEFSDQAGEGSLVVTEIARDAIAVVVHPGNPVDSITLYQLRDVFEGRLTNWTQLWGPDLSLQVVSREDGSGTRAVFEKLVMRDRRVTPTAVIMPSSQAVRQQVAEQSGAIAYLSMGYLAAEARALAIDGIAPDRESIADGTYPIVRPFLLVSLPNAKSEVAAFTQFVRSPAGQAIVTRTLAGPGR
jgi:phosphate transport system substrate-binding protein